MKNSFKTCSPLRSLILTGFILLATSRSGAQQMKPADSGYAPVNGTDIYYEVYGEGRPIVLLHGAFMTIKMNWGELIPELSKSRKVIAIELQGHGHSPYSERKLDRAVLASDVEEVMNFLKVDSADVVGYSMGGTIAYQFAVQSPKRLRKLVIISSTYKTDGWLPIVNSAFEGFEPEFFDDTPLKTAYDAVAPNPAKWSNFIEQMIEFANVPFDVGDDNIAKITAPVLIIAGDNDGTDKVELMKTYQLLGGGKSDLEPMPKSRLAIVPSQNHVSLMMQTNSIRDYLEDFFLD